MALARMMKKGNGCRERLEAANHQLDDVIRMVEEGIPCMEIATRLILVQADLKRANQEILKDYLSRSFPSLLQEGEKDDNSLQEMMDIMARIMN
jgi:DNA-binding FrmR family transcriptional regulator